MMKRLPILLLAAMAFLSLCCTHGCATLQSLSQATTQPTTPQGQLDAFQRDLDTAKAGANLAHELGAFQKSSEWENVQAGFATAQLVIKTERDELADPTKTLTQEQITSILNGVAQAVRDAKAGAKS